jgi:hypothetical protein
MNLSRKALISTLLAAGLALALSYPWIGAFVDELWTDRKNLLTIREGEQIERFEIQDKPSTVLWRIVAPKPTVLPRLEYGNVPLGFVQEVPDSGGSPRAFREGETLITETVTPSRTFRHECSAVGIGKVRCGSWTSTPLKAGGPNPYGPDSSPSQQP